MSATFKPGEVAPCSGVYRVRHAQHRLDHCVTILQGEQFPVCRKCGVSVLFRLHDATSGMTAVHGRFRVILEEYSVWRDKGGKSPLAA